MALSKEQRNTISKWAAAAIIYRERYQPVQRVRLEDVIAGKGVGEEFRQLIEAATEEIDSIGPEGKKEFMRLMGIKFV